MIRLHLRFSEQFGWSERDCNVPFDFGFEQPTIGKLCTRIAQEFGLEDNLRISVATELRDSWFRAAQSTSMLRNNEILSISADDEPCDVTRSSSNRHVGVLAMGRAWSSETNSLKTQTSLMDRRLSPQRSTVTDATVARLAQLSEDMQAVANASPSPALRSSPEFLRGLELSKQELEFKKHELEFKTQHEFKFAMPYEAAGGTKLNLSRGSPAAPSAALEDSLLRSFNQHQLSLTEELRLVAAKNAAELGGETVESLTPRNEGFERDIRQQDTVQCEIAIRSQTSPVPRLLVPLPWPELTSETTEMHFESPPLPSPASPPSRASPPSPASPPLQQLSPTIIPSIIPVRSPSLSPSPSKPSPSAPSPAAPSPSVPAPSAPSPTTFSPSAPLYCVPTPSNHTASTSMHSAHMYAPAPPALSHSSSSLTPATPSPSAPCHRSARLSPVRELANAKNSPRTYLRSQLDGSRLS